MTDLVLLTWLINDNIFTNAQGLKKVKYEPWQDALVVI